MCNKRGEGHSREKKKNGFRDRGRQNQVCTIYPSRCTIFKSIVLALMPEPTLLRDTWEA